MADNSEKSPGISDDLQCKLVFIMFHEFCCVCVVRREANMTEAASKN